MADLTAGQQWNVYKQFGEFFQSISAIGKGIFTGNWSAFGNPGDSIVNIVKLTVPFLAGNAGNMNRIMGKAGSPMILALLGLGSLFMVPSCNRAQVAANTKAGAAATKAAQQEKEAKAKASAIEQQLATKAATEQEKAALMSQLADAKAAVEQLRTDGQAQNEQLSNLIKSLQDQVKGLNDQIESQSSQIQDQQKALDKTRGDTFDKLDRLNKRLEETGKPKTTPKKASLSTFLSPDSPDVSYLSPLEGQPELLDASADHGVVLEPYFP